MYYKHSLNGFLNALCPSLTIIKTRKMRKQVNSSKNLKNVKKKIEHTSILFVLLYCIKYNLLTTFSVFC